MACLPKFAARSHSPNFVHHIAEDIVPVFRFGALEDLAAHRAEDPDLNPKGEPTSALTFVSSIAPSSDAI
jgi:hypothetical protein